jgi:hypothetical protein
LLALILKNNEWVADPDEVDNFDEAINMSLEESDLLEKIGNRGKYLLGLTLLSYFTPRLLKKKKEKPEVKPEQSGIDGGKTPLEFDVVKDKKDFHGASAEDYKAK